MCSLHSSMLSSGLPFVQLPALDIYIQFLQLTLPPLITPLHYCTCPNLPLYSPHSPSLLLDLSHMCFSSPLTPSYSPICPSHPSLHLFHSISSIPSDASTSQATDVVDSSKTTSVRVYVNITDINEAPFFLRSHFYGEVSEYSIVDTVVVDHLEAQDLDYVRTFLCSLL